MGIKHISIIEEELKKNNELYSADALVKRLNIDKNTILQVLAYLIKEEKVEKLKSIVGISYYRWKDI